ncbi:hypothetical protein CFB44_32015 [Burkholderia sp. AU31280]|nr:hypothetical protein CFB44_32015 [Burkholderia sp. AU31280]
MHRAERVAPACRYLGPSHLDVSVVASAWSLRKTPRKYCPSAIAFESRTSWANRAVQSACPSDRGPHIFRSIESRGLPTRPAGGARAWNLLHMHGRARVVEQWSSDNSISSPRPMRRVIPATKTIVCYRMFLPLSSRP